MPCRFAVGEGDLITFLNIWKGWEDGGRSRKWCYKNFINHRTMLRAADIRNQLQRHFRCGLMHLAYWPPSCAGYASLTACLHNPLC